MAHQPDRYPFAKSLQKFCALLQIPPERVLKRAGLPLDIADHENRGMTGAQIASIFIAAVDEAGGPDLIIDIARRTAHGSFNPAMLAFSCSRNIEVGLRRLAVFKPLVGPVCITCDRTSDRLSISVSSTDTMSPMTSYFATFELVFFLELCRTHTGAPVVPLFAGLPEVPCDRAKLESFVGAPVGHSDTVRIDLTLEDAARPLISENEEIWPNFEKELRRQLLERQKAQPMSVRVKTALLDLLPSGQATADAVCARLLVSKRSLYRYLSREGQTFQAILDDTRTELSLHYLRHDDVSVEEISYLLAYSDPNSFYRAFRSWTGMTPAQAREQRVQ